MPTIIRNPTFEILPQKGIQGLDVPKTIELIHCRKKIWRISIKEVLKEIDERGFISAQPPYLKGLEMQ